ncbi:putative Tetraspanin [Seiridium cardinale]|uniref:Tetraspanin n=1 Tax=Seiridium cardinale TaxID=138064 RepID=A0ABR2XZJ4_9PEZI
MVNKVLAAFVAMDGLFALMGAIMMGFSVVVLNTCFDPPTDGNEAARDLLYQRFPLTAGIANAALTLFIFLLTLPALATPARGWLKFAGYLIVADTLFTLIIGLDLWIITLKTRQEFFNIWVSQNANVQSLLQGAFQCCGYNNSTSPAFVTDVTCPSPAAAALIKGCAAPLTSFSNVFVDNIFTAVFGMVGVDVAMIMAIACLSKDRKERERFRYIDEKNGVKGGF